MQSKIYIMLHANNQVINLKMPATIETAKLPKASDARVPCE